MGAVRSPRSPCAVASGSSGPRASPGRPSCTIPDAAERTWPRALCGRVKIGARAPASIGIFSPAIAASGTTRSAAAIAASSRMRRRVDVRRSSRRQSMAPHSLPCVAAWPAVPVDAHHRQRSPHGSSPARGARTARSRDVSGSGPGSDCLSTARKGHPIGAAIPRAVIAAPRACQSASVIRVSARYTEKPSVPAWASNST